MSLKCRDSKQIGGCYATEVGELAYVAGEFVDRSVLGHVVLFIRIILWSDDREFSTINYRMSDQ